MDFTREPITETIITPKEGCKLVVRSSKSTGQEEYFVDSVEVVSFGHSFFFRSLERPKSFLVPVSDYEILEVREARMVLKNVGMDRSIKIAGGREGNVRGGREAPQERVEPAHAPSEEYVSAAEGTTADGKVDKKRDRRRHSRRRRGRDDAAPKDGSEEEGQEEGGRESEVKVQQPTSRQNGSQEGATSGEQMVTPSSVISSLLPPPTTLISETISRYKDNELFKGAFFLREQDQGADQGVGAGEVPSVPLVQPEFGSYEASDAEAEEVYRLRASQTHVIPGAYTLSGDPIVDASHETPVEAPSEPKPEDEHPEDPNGNR